MGQHTSHKTSYGSKTSVVVEQGKEWWQALYTICLTEVTRAIREKDDLDLEHVFRILPVLAEAAQSPDLEALEAELRLVAGRYVTEAERAEARQAVVSGVLMPERIGA